MYEMSRLGQIREQVARMLFGPPRGGADPDVWWAEMERRYPNDVAACRAEAARIEALYVPPPDGDAYTDVDALYLDAWGSDEPGRMHGFLHPDRRGIDVAVLVTADTLWNRIRMRLVGFCIRDHGTDESEAA